MSTEHRDQDRDLEWVERRWAREEKASPPDLLDQAVLNRARRAAPARKKAPARWMGGLATAAVVVLALALVLKREPGSPTEEVQRNTAPAAAPQRTQDALPEDSFSADRAMPPAEALTVESGVAERKVEKSVSAPVLMDAEARQDSLKPADAWMDELRALYSQGQHEALAVELQRFMAAYPLVELPQELLPFADRAAEALPDNPPEDP
jgi:hypothetical protein